MPSSTYKQKKKVMKKWIKKTYKKNKISKQIKTPKIFTYNLECADQYITNSNIAGGIAITTPGPFTLANFTNPTPGVLNNYYGIGFGTGPTGSPSTSGINIAAFSNYTSYTNLYDLYKINSVTMEVKFLSNTAAVNGQGLLPTVYYASDPDEGAAPTTDQQIKRLSGSKEFNLSQKNNLNFTYTFKPKQSIAVASSGLFTSYTPSKSSWQDCNNPNIYYNGFKMWLENINLSSTGSVFTVVRLSMKMNISFKRPILLSA